MRTYDIAEGESSLQCNECKHHLKCVESLAQHMKYNHPNKPFNCNSCDFVSKTMGGLRKHKRKSHPNPKELKSSMKIKKRDNLGAFEKAEEKIGSTSLQEAS